MKINARRISVAKEFERIIDEIQDKKIRNGTANIRNRRTYSTSRITLAMTRHRDMQRVIQDIINTRLE